MGRSRSRGRNVAKGHDNRDGGRGNGHGAGKDSARDRDRDRDHDRDHDRGRSGGRDLEWALAAWKRERNRREELEKLAKEAELKKKSEQDAKDMEARMQMGISSALLAAGVATDGKTASTGAGNDALNPSAQFPGAAGGFQATGSGSSPSTGFPMNMPPPQGAAFMLPPQWPPLQPHAMQPPPQPPTLPQWLQPQSAGNQMGMPMTGPTAGGNGRAVEWAWPFMMNAMPHGFPWGVPAQVLAQIGDNSPKANPKEQRLNKPGNKDEAEGAPPRREQGDDPLLKRLKMIDEAVGRLNGASLRAARARDAPRVVNRSSPRVGAAARGRSSTRPTASGSRGDASSSRGRSGGVSDGRRSESEQRGPREGAEDEDHGDSREGESDTSSRRAHAKSRQPARLPVRGRRRELVRQASRGRRSADLSPQSERHGEARTASERHTGDVAGNNNYVEMDDEAYQATEVAKFINAAAELAECTDVEEEPPLVEGNQDYEKWAKWFHKKAKPEAINELMKEYNILHKVATSKKLKIVKLLKFYIAHV